MPAHAQTAAQHGDYPNRPIRLITPAQPGGTTDILARLFGIKLADTFKQQIVVDNRASASGVIAGELTAKAQPDGYTLYMAYHQHTVNAALNLSGSNSPPLGAHSFAVVVGVDTPQLAAGLFIYLILSDILYGIAYPECALVLLIHLRN